MRELPQSAKVYGVWRNTILIIVYRLSIQNIYITTLPKQTLL